MNMTTDARHVERRAAAVRSEFLTFRIGAEEYGIDILKVQEIRSYEHPPASPTHRLSSRA